MLALFVILMNTDIPSAMAQTAAYAIAGPAGVSGFFGGNRPSQKLAPFVTAGYTRMGSGEGSFNAWNVGAGANYWVGRRVGVRMEFRDHVRPDVRGTVQYWAVRAGVAVR